MKRQVLMGLGVMALLLFPRSGAFVLAAGKDLPVLQPASGYSVELVSEYQRDATARALIPIRRRLIRWEAEWKMETGSHGAVSVARQVAAAKTLDADLQARINRYKWFPHGSFWQARQGFDREFAQLGWDCAWVKNRIAGG